MSHLTHFILAPKEGEGACERNAVSGLLAPRWRVLAMTVAFCAVGFVAGFVLSLVVAAGSLLWAIG